MKTTVVVSQGLAYRLLAALAAAFLFLGTVKATGVEDLVVYLLVVLCGLLPAALWIREGSVGIPILPILGLAHIIYYGLPVLSSDTILLEYTKDEIYTAATTAALFLAVASAGTLLHKRQRRQAASTGTDLLAERQMLRLMFIGMTFGTVMHAAVVTGLFLELGAVFGLVRSITLTAFTLSCFLMGVTRGQGILRGSAWAAAALLFVINLALDWVSLFLVGGIVNAIAAGAGYVIATRRVPWAAGAGLLAAVFVLHAGKSQMRDEYWLDGGNSGQAISLIEVPERIVQWAWTGVTTLGGGDPDADADAASIVGRASLLQMLAMAQHHTPSNIDYLGGDTYAMFPQMLIPRFIVPDKPASQAAMDFLNRRYGLIAIDEDSKTAIGWGLLAESYANFGYYGVIAIGALLGLASSAMTRWSSRGSAFSLRTLLTIAALMNLISLETDFSYLIVNMWQTAISVLIFYGTYSLLLYREERQGNDQTLRAAAMRGRR